MWFGQNTDGLSETLLALLVKFEEQQQQLEEEEIPSETLSMYNFIKEEEEEGEEAISPPPSEVPCEMEGGYLVFRELLGSKKSLLLLPPTVAVCPCHIFYVPNLGDDYAGRGPLSRISCH